jgi:hypothetical protein
MTRFAFGAKCGNPASTPTRFRSAPRESCANSDASAAVPMPVAVRPKKCRR